MLFSGVEERFKKELGQILDLNATKQLNNYLKNVGVST